MSAAFDGLTFLNRVEAWANVENVASCRVLEKLGMAREGVLRERGFIRGSKVSEAWYGVLRSEWRAGASGRRR